MSIETAIEKAEREMREATKRSAEKRKKLLADLQLTEQEVAQQGGIRSLTPTFKEETKQPPVTTEVQPLKIEEDAPKSEDTSAGGDAPLLANSQR